MKSSAALAVVVLAAISASSALGQTPAPSTAPPVAQAPPASGAAPATVPVPRAPGADGKRMACRQDIAAKGLRGQDGRDQMQLCMAQGQVDCVKQAIDQKIVGPQRQDFMKTCMGRRLQ